MRPEICPPHHSHGENSTCRSLHHCKCDECRQYAREYEFWRAAQKRRGRPLLIDATGTHRRIRALGRIGYSRNRIAQLAGRSEAWVGNVLRVKKVTPATAQVVRDLYDLVSMRPAVGVTKDERAAVTKARRYAEAMGYPPPLAWDDIDNRLERPNGAVA